MIYRAWTVGITLRRGVELSVARTVGLEDRLFHDPLSTLAASKPPLIPLRIRSSNLIIFCDIVLDLHVNE